MNNSNYVLVLYTETGNGGFSRKNWKTCIQNYNSTVILNHLICKKDMSFKAVFNLFDQFL